MTDQQDSSGMVDAIEILPQEARKNLSQTAGDIAKDLAAPLTATTSGIGRLINAKFDTMIDVQRLWGQQTVKQAADKIEAANSELGARPQSRVILNSLEYASEESEDEIRDIWANLIANEMISNDVHPEFPSILARLSARDAHVLSNLAKKSSVTAAVALALLSIFIPPLQGMRDAALEQLAKPLPENSASHEHLMRLGLIHRTEAGWMLTRFGTDFLKSVTVPLRGGSNKDQS